MKGVRYLKIDAFSRGGSSGNPAGVVHLEDLQDLAPEEMQEIARGQKGIVSEVVFCAPKGPGAFALRYYSSECEVEFCGHGSIACMYNLVKSDRSLAHETKVLIETRKGILPVLNDVAGSDSVYITAPSPKYLDCHSTGRQIARSLGVLDDQVDDTRAIALIDGGLRTLVVPFRSLDDVLSARPDMENLSRFCVENGADIVLIYSPETADRANEYRTRVFAPKYGYLEDPATGSGSSAFGYHLLKQDEWGGDTFSIEQGPDRGRPNIVKLRGTWTDGERRVLFGGSAIVRYERHLSV